MLELKRLPVYNGTSRASFYSGFKDYILMVERYVGIEIILISVNNSYLFLNSTEMVDSLTALQITI